MDPKNMESLSERSYVSPIYIGIVYGALGERNQEFALYTKAYEDRHPLRHRPEPRSKSVHHATQLPISSCSVRRHEQPICFPQLYKVFRTERFVKLQTQTR